MRNICKGIFFILLIVWYFVAYYDINTCTSTVFIYYMVWLYFTYVPVYIGFQEQDITQRNKSIYK